MYIWNINKSQEYNKVNTRMFKNIDQYQELESPHCPSLVTAPTKVTSILPSNTAD